VDEGVAGLVTLWPNESVFCEPFAAGPLEVRVRRVAGIAAGSFWGESLGIWKGLGGCDVKLGVDDEGMEGAFAGQRAFELERFREQAAANPPLRQLARSDSFIHKMVQYFFIFENL
jgi:hypothetical protein